MKRELSRNAAFTIVLLVSALQSAGVLAQGDPRTIAGQTKESTTESRSNVAAGYPPNLFVSKTAHVSGQDVCGVIRITNLGMGPATIVGIADALEVRFQSNIPPYPMPAGSTPNWFKIADVPISVPGPIAPRKTATINYCFSLCQAADYPGAASMRNAVRVSVANPPGAPRIFPALSNTFAPPILDCQACCLPDGSCLDTLPAQCSNAGGLARGTGTDCATTECPEACCHPDDSCTDDPPSVCQTASGEPKGAGTDCATTQCCEPPGSVCTSGLDCCGENAACTGNTCCIELAGAGCANDSDCCEGASFGVTCAAGKCCAVNGATCGDHAHCCDAPCNGSTCCFELGDTGCANDSDCCEGASFGVTCAAGKCCAVNGATCGDHAHCCDAPCNGSICCFDLGETGCANDSDCCEGNSFGVTCAAGKCCAVNGAGCGDDAHCCENTICEGSACCLPLFRSGCSTDAECCTGLICDSGMCNNVASP